MLHRYCRLMHDHPCMLMPEILLSGSLSPAADGGFRGAEVKEKCV